MTIEYTMSKMTITKIINRTKTALLSLAAAASFALPGSSIAAVVVPTDQCFTASDLADLQRDFFQHFPDAGAFSRYADKERFELLTNAPPGRELRDNHRPTREKIAWLLSVFTDYRELFAGFSFERPDFTYMKGQLKGAEATVNNLRTRKHFPKDECVQEVNYDLPGGPCVGSQMLTRLSITFVKDERPLRLSSVEMFFNRCKSE